MLSHKRSHSEFARNRRKRYGPPPIGNIGEIRSCVTPGQSFHLYDFWESYLDHCLRFLVTSMIFVVIFQQDQSSILALQESARTHGAVTQLSKGFCWGPRYSEQCRNLVTVTKMWCHNSMLLFGHDLKDRDPRSWVVGSWYEGVYEIYHELPVQPNPDVPSLPEIVRECLLDWSNPSWSEWNCLRRFIWEFSAVTFRSRRGRYVLFRTQNWDWCHFKHSFFHDFWQYLCRTCWGSLVESDDHKARC